jgi:hypothetical protein
MEEKHVGSEFVPLLGKLLVMLIALEAVCIIGTHKARVFPWLGRGIKKTAKWLWRKFWRLIRWLVKVVWRGLRELFGRRSPQQTPGQNRPNP